MHMTARIGSVLLLAALLAVVGCTRSPEASRGRYLSRADGYFDRQRLPEAIIEYMNVLRIEPGHAHSITRVAIAHFEIGQLGLAFPFLLKAKELDPANVEVRTRVHAGHHAHGHTREAEAFIPYTDSALIDRAAAEGFQVLAITNHDTLTMSPRLADDARQRGILLLPGAEATIEGRHVLLYNFDVPLSAIGTFERLRRFKTPDWLVVAAHPFFPAPISLGSRLREELDVFDAIELSHFYTPAVDFNRKAVALARETGLPLLGCSDSHLTRQLGTTYSLLDAAPTVDCVISAIRSGRVQVVSRPLRLHEMVSIGAQLMVGELRQRVRRRTPEPWPPAPLHSPLGPP